MEKDDRKSLQIELKSNIEDFIRQKAGPLFLPQIVFSRTETETNIRLPIQTVGLVGSESRVTSLAENRNVFHQNFSIRTLAAKQEINT